MPLLEGTYFIAFRDQSGVRSVTPVGIPAVLPTPQPRLTVKTWAEESEVPEFNGVDTNLGYDAGYDGLFLDPSVALTGHYVYEETLDLVQVYDVNGERCTCLLLSRSEFESRRLLNCLPLRYKLVGNM